MYAILTVTGPIFLLIGVGYLAVRSGRFPATGLGALSGFVIGYALPALMFKALSQRSLAEVMHGRFLLAYALGSLLSFGLALAWTLRQGRSLDEAALAGLGASVSNSAFIGLPVAQQVVGPDAQLLVALVLLVENLLMIPLALSLADTGSSRAGSFGQAVRAALAALPRNPLIIAISAGFACALFGLRLPGPVVRAVDLLASASAAAALFYIGGTLAGLAVAGMAREVVPVASFKLLLHPLAVAGVLLLLVGTDEPRMLVGGVLFAAMPMLSIYPILAHRYGRQGVCAARMVAATLASFFTLGATLWVLDRLMGQALAG